MTIEEMDEAYSNLKTEYFDIQDKLTTARQLIDDYEKDTLKLKKQLEIAIKYLKIICDDYNCSTCMSCIGSAFAKTALYEIKELDK